MIESMEVFSILDKKKLSMIMDIIDEGIIKDPFHDSVMDNLEEMGFTQEQSRNIAECFYNFYLALQYPDKLKEQINKADVKEDTKQLIMETFEYILKKGDKDVVLITEKAEAVALFGHNHLHKFGVMSEFRPIVDNHKLQKMVVSVVVTGLAHESDRSPSTPINFQMKLNEFESFVRMLNERLEQIKMEVKTLEEKLGGDIVSV